MGRNKSSFRGWRNMAKEIVVTIERDGTSKVEANGFKGKGCAEATQSIELVLAGNDPSARSDQKKPDFFATHGNAATLKR